MLAASIGQGYGRTAAVGHSMSRRPIELLAALAPSLAAVFPPWREDGARPFDRREGRSSALDRRRLPCQPSGARSLRLPARALPGGDVDRIWLAPPRRSASSSATPLPASTPEVHRNTTPFPAAVAPSLVVVEVVQHLELGLEGKFAAKSTGWDENRVLVEGDQLEIAKRAKP